MTICVGVERPILALLDPDTLRPLATYDLPVRIPGAGSNPFTDFSGGGYFYLDDRDRAIMPTTDRHVYVIAQTAEPGFERVADYDLNGPVTSDDKVISALPDWRGGSGSQRWRASWAWIDPSPGRSTRRTWASRSATRSPWTRRAPSTSSPTPRSTAFARGRARCASSGGASIRTRGWSSRARPRPGSGTTPTLLAGGKLVAITDNADPMNVLAFRRAAATPSRRRVCKEPVFEEGASATDQCLIGAGRTLIAENNYGYSIANTELGGTTEPGLQAVGVKRGAAAAAGRLAVRTRSRRPWCPRRPRGPGSSTRTRSRKGRTGRSLVPDGA